MKELISSSWQPWSWEHWQFVAVAGLWINKRDHDVPCSFSDRQTLMVVCQSPRVHQHPSEPSVCDTAVVTDEPAATSLQSKVTRIFSLFNQVLFVYYHRCTTSWFLSVCQQITAELV